MRAQAGAAAALALLATFAFGALRLHGLAPAQARVGLVVLRGPVRPSVVSAEGAALLQRYLAAIDSLAAQGAKTVVLPENAFAVGPGNIAQLAARATQLGITIDSGAAAQDAAGTQRNMALAFSPTGAAPVSYAKRHLIPGLESQYAPGTRYTMLPATRTGLAICKDMDFQAIGRAYGERGANLLLVPAWDFGIDGWLHSRMAVMRGVESGFALARAARRGQLTVSDNRGRVVAEASDAQGDAILVASVPLYTSTTLYTRWGDWFVWLAGGVLVLVAAGTRLRSAQPGMNKAAAAAGHDGK
jgi:apolipoprotein N-acyltransferase